MRCAAPLALLSRLFLGVFFLCITSLALRSGAASAQETAFTSTVESSGGTILTGTLGRSSLPVATGMLLRAVHDKLGTRPTIVQAVQDARDHSVTLLFTATRAGTPFTGIGIVTAAPGSQASGAALYDTTARFPTTVGPMMQHLGGMTVAGSAVTHPAHVSPAQPLVTHPFTDGTGSIGVPADWKLAVADGGSAMAISPNGTQVSYNMHSSAFDPSNPRAQMYLRSNSPMLRAMNAVVVPYTSDPQTAWVAILTALGKKNGLPPPDVHIIGATKAGEVTSMTGTIGTGSQMLTFINYIFVLPPNPNGLWSISDSHILAKSGSFANEGATAIAVLSSVHINFGAVAAQQSAIREMFQKQFETEIANDQAQDRQRQIGTDEALANDRAAQENMHRQAVSMENYSLDRAVVVNTRTGQHSTVGSSFADDLVQGNSNFQRVPAQNLLRGVDY